MNANSTGKKRGLVWPLVIVVVLALGGGVYWYKHKSAAAESKTAQAKGQRRPAPVGVVPARTRDVDIFLTGLGTVTPLSSVTVKSRVDGQLMSVLFKEGQEVRAGQLLLVIDPRPFEVQRAQAEGQMRHDQALLDNAKLDLNRYAALVKDGAIARQQYDTQLSLVRQYEGAVATDKAAVDNANLQITYCRITAPCSGQVGLRQVDPGNMVRSSDQTGLLVINQIEPITVLFTLPEDQLPRVLDRVRAGAKSRVDAYDREQRRKLAQGELASLDNQIDPNTGTVRLKAVFPNKDRVLYPNQFVNARLLIETKKDALVIPTAAVQHGQQGDYVFVVTEENVAASRPVKVSSAGDADSIVLEGIQAGERVVVEGADRLRDGAPVEIKVPGQNGGGKGGHKGQEGQGGSPSGAANASAPATPSVSSGNSSAAAN